MRLSDYRAPAATLADSAQTATLREALWGYVDELLRDEDVPPDYAWYRAHDEANTLLALIDKVIHDQGGRREA